MNAGGAFFDINYAETQTRPLLGAERLNLFDTHMNLIHDLKYALYLAS